MKVHTILEALTRTSTVEYREPIGAGPTLTDFVVTVDQAELEALGEGAFGRAHLREFTHAAVWGLILLRTLERAGTPSSAAATATWRPRWTWPARLRKATSRRCWNESRPRASDGRPAGARLPPTLRSSRTR
ncbi:hypothetical protein BKM31_14520 [[Actinomadura] parvosata subsp. kistnae]|uniref:Uncharacterized protein n=1 Tax=[Actinomadura] parvosata subsp. kistnae TaxID=1909395 RepID=A0A1U9ZX34_9ACTN|nr:hypothetical protein BKM31_14520 [Nonomuraea sp. ATCC 55076]